MLIYLLIETFKTDDDVPETRVAGGITAPANDNNDGIDDEDDIKEQ